MTIESSINILHVGDYRAAFNLCKIKQRWNAGSKVCTVDWTRQPGPSDHALRAQWWLTDYERSPRLELVA